ncbi:contact-dependent growth inhibition system immunity protein [Bacillus cereus group sp. TH43LC]|nr:MULTISPECIES: contact-dependent growth inhibition system immunity protein [unclassified Bacillus cereus group]MCR6793309.1 contact-dependent growth inhibition system immunity protein [Bacillus paranthracis]MDA1500032.1 contact-dependent growth inhibition system immunity protein [Bacillus cereus group sp. TH43LC]MDA1786997.1 contact-dependent growth inhibition system immunity protein [Bacillus cereus group sp. BY5-1LC]MDA1862868.1 contact-dependent growth inhibition system immunity protein [B
MFHQDIGTVEKALNEFIEEAHKVCIENTVKHITEFSKSDLSTQEKEEFIEYYTEIYFPSLKLNPIE